MIAVNDSGVLRNLGEVSANDGGTLKKLNTVHANDSGVLKKVFESSKPISSLNVGSTVKIKVNGATKNFIIVHKGLPSSLYDSSCNGIWVMMWNISTSMIFGGNNNDYQYSVISQWLNGTFYNQLDANTKKVIKTVRIPFHRGSGAVQSGSNGLSCNVFTLSGYEVGWTNSISKNFPVDGACLSYFLGTDDTDYRRVGYYGGSAFDWWLRSPNTNINFNRVWYVTSDGGHNYAGSGNGGGVRPVMILQNTAKVDNNGFIAA